ncbi:cytochrome b [Zophobihabitans entericus]|uniref:Cytochrome b n=1 Tax=Zophobihabitans entericus TaxID=1635327 RepID=A0A6G9IDU7_9GAMM|nr:cytochrome b/b6 domain-containing protein [Zophobihabitans entericus]QIQ22007.1 cytochrome b [Zophobihabitans entericus]
MNTAPKYSPLQMFIHWLSAILVILVITLPLMKGVLADSFGGMGNLFMIHKSLGVLIFFITICRIVVIIRQGVPEVLAKHQKLQRILSKAVQGMIYLLLLVLPLSGYLMSSRTISFFGLFTINGLNLPASLQSFLHSVHIFSAYLIIALILLHILAALYHHYWCKDNVLRSMLPIK